MNKKKQSVNEIITLFESSPREAYNSLISSNHHFYTKNTQKFWKNYSTIHDRLVKKFPNSIYIQNKLPSLKLIYTINELYKEFKQEKIDKIIALNPNETSLVKSLFLCLEIGETGVLVQTFPKYSEESLEAIKKLLKEIIPKLNNSNKSSYSKKLTHITVDLVRVQSDMIILLKFLDTMVWSDFKITEKKDSKGFVLGLSENNKTKNLFILNEIKSNIKREFEREESQLNISNEEHFKKIDPKLKTNEGLATVFYSGGLIVTDITKGQVALPLDDSIPSNNSEHLMSKFLEQNFHYQFRQALSKIYNPNDEINVHALHIEIETDVFVSIYDLMIAMSCLIAKADAYRYFSDATNSGSIKSIIKAIKNLTNGKYNDETPIEKENITNNTIIEYLSMFEKEFEIFPFVFLSERDVLNCFNKITELKSKPEKELKAILNLLSNKDLQIPFNPLYKIDDKYYFSYITLSLGRFDVNKLFYDYYMSNKLFNPYKQPKEKSITINNTQRNREIRFTKSLKMIFKNVTPFVDSSIEYGDINNHDFGDLRGEFDVIAYFKKENIIFPIQVKLSNVSSRTEKRKEEWVRKRILEKGKKQIIKDVKLLNTKTGLKFIKEKLNIKLEIINPKIYPIIITDNFFADHISIEYNESLDKVFCISYFEIKNIILNNKINKNQKEMLPFSAQNLINTIESNDFWNFIDDIANNYKYSKKLLTIDNNNRIDMII